MRLRYNVIINPFQCIIANDTQLTTTFFEMMFAWMHFVNWGLSWMIGGSEFTSTNIKKRKSCVAQEVHPVYWQKTQDQQVYSAQ